MNKDYVVEIMVMMKNVKEVLVVGGHHMFQIKVALAMEATIEDPEEIDTPTTAGHLAANVGVLEVQGPVTPIHKENRAQSIILVVQKIYIGVENCCVSFRYLLLVRGNLKENKPKMAYSRDLSVMDDFHG